MDTTRARTELGWQPTRTSREALLDLLKGMREGEGIDTPSLEPDSVKMRLAELGKGVGRANPY